MQESESKNFLKVFTGNLKTLFAEYPTARVFSEDFSFANLPFYAEFDCDEQLAHAEEIRVATDKIMSIIRKPHIKVDTSEIVIRSELSGKLSHDSFAETLRDPQLWKDKNGTMSPEYVHTVETVDSINIYENQFISMFLDELENDIQMMLADVAPLVESLQEHFERTDKTFGQYSMFKGFAKSKAPFTPFFLSEGQNQEELLMLCEKLEKRIKNLKGTEFYRLTSNKRFNHNVIPTNILMHDPLYNHCYKMYVASYQKKNNEDKNDDLYYNYVVASFARYLSKATIYKPDSNPLIGIDALGHIQMQQIRIRKDNFAFYMRLDNENHGIICKVFYMGGKRKDLEKREARYYLAVSHSYTEKNEKAIKAFIREQRQFYDDVLLVTAKNVIKQFHDVVNLSYHRKDGGVLIKNVLASMMMLFEAKIGLYHSRCPFCGNEEITFTGKNYVCAHCGSNYSIFPQYNRDLVWLTTIGRAE